MLIPKKKLEDTKQMLMLKEFWPGGLGCTLYHKCTLLMMSPDSETEAGENYDTPMEGFGCWDARHYGSIAVDRNGGEEWRSRNYFLESKYNRVMFPGIQC